MSFPTSKSLQCKIFESNARPQEWTEAHSRACARTKQKRKSAYAHNARLWVAIPARLRQKVREKIRVDFSSIADELTVNQVGRGRFLNLQVSEIKRKANEAQMREEFIPNSPVWSPICLHSSRRCVSKK